MTEGMHSQATCPACLTCLPPSLQAGLIGAAKETAKDGRLRQQLHRQWAEQQDDKELQQLMAGLKNGFRRRRGGGFFDDEVSESSKAGWSHGPRLSMPSSSLGMEGERSAGGCQC